MIFTEDILNKKVNELFDKYPFLINCDISCLFNYSYQEERDLFDLLFHRELGECNNCRFDKLADGYSCKPNKAIYFNKKHNRVSLRDDYCYKYCLKEFTESLPIKFNQCSFENFQITENNKIAVEKCKKYINNFDYKTGLLIIGSYGSGKTHLTISILKELIKQYLYCDYNINSSPCFLVSISDLFFEMKKGFDKEETSKIEKRAFSNLLIAFDDLGAEKTTEWTTEQLYILINKRYENEVPTIFTSNYTVQELEEKISKRIVSRIIEMTEGVLLIGEDYRKKKTK